MSNINYVGTLYIYIYKLAVTSFRKEVRPNCVNDNGRYRKYQFHYNHINYLKEDL